MDSHVSHGFTFNEGISPQLICKDQTELDRYRKELSANGEPGPCGWLKDRFGLSWQVVPAALDAWLSSPDVAARERALRAIWKMGKLEIAAVQAAFEGRVT
jgi:predicted 3-demethylubiquinone-9 3-methyltransferase (glyoxalase superfamily)